MSIAEKIDTILQNFGYKVENLTIMDKLIFLNRFLPIVEKKFRLVEFSKEATGKTFLYGSIFKKYTELSTNFSEREIWGHGGSPTSLGKFYKMNDQGIYELTPIIYFDEIPTEIQTNDLIRNFKIFFNNNIIFYKTEKIVNKGTDLEEKISEVETEASCIFSSNVYNPFKNGKRNISNDRKIELKNLKNFNFFDDAMISRIDLLNPLWNLSVSIERSDKLGIEFFDDDILKKINENQIDEIFKLRENEVNYKPHIFSSRTKKQIASIMMGYIKLLNLSEEDEKIIRAFERWTEYLKKLSSKEEIEDLNLLYSDELKYLYLNLVTQYLKDKPTSEIEKAYIKDDRIIIKLFNVNRYYKIALNIYGIENNIKEKEFYDNYKNKEELAEVFSLSKNQIILEQEYIPYQNEVGKIEVSLSDSRYKEKIKTLENKLLKLENEKEELKEELYTFIDCFDEIIKELENSYNIQVKRYIKKYNKELRVQEQFEDNFEDKPKKSKGKDKIGKIKLIDFI